jgi:hypothetical protein
MCSHDAEMRSKVQKQCGALYALFTGVRAGGGVRADADSIGQELAQLEAEIALEGLSLDSARKTKPPSVPTAPSNEERSSPGELSKVWHGESAEAETKTELVSVDGGAKDVSLIEGVEHDETDMIEKQSPMT